MSLPAPIPRERFSARDVSYSLLPFRFDHRRDGTYLLVNEAGEYHVLPDRDFTLLVEHRLPPQSVTFQHLRAKQFVSDGNSSALLDFLAAKYRTKKSFLDGFAKLHIFVTTLRCNHSCQYCQVSRRNESSTGSTMSSSVLRRSVDLMLSTPSPQLTVEFQGGEPLLEFDTLREIVEYASEKSLPLGKSLEFVICTNLASLQDEHLAFFAKHSVNVSTSLDGPAYLHDRHRPLGGGPSHETVVRNIQRVRDALGAEAVSCLMTATRESLKYPREVVDEYLRLDLGSLFIRELNPYGFAVTPGKQLDYSSESFVRFYREALSYILEVNRRGRTFAESFATILLSKLLTPWPVGFVDLQSPSGAGFGAVVYNYDGNVYPSDESRMLAEMGQPIFRLGNVLEHSYEDMFFGPTMQMLASASCNEALAGCSDCAYQAFCGADPVRNYRLHGDIFGTRADRGFCQKNKGIITYLMDLVESADRDTERILWAWIQGEDVLRMQMGTKPCPTS